MAIANVGGSWIFSVRIVGEDGKEPPSGVSYTAESPFGPMPAARKEPAALELLTKP